MPLSNFMTEIRYCDRKTGKEETEKVYGQFFLELLYGRCLFFRFLSFFLLPLVAKVPFLSRLYGGFQKSRWSRFKVQPFIRDFHVDAAEFLDPVESFSSFNDFFIRRLKPGSRPIAADAHVAVLPADARYLVFPRVDSAEGIWVKGQHFSLTTLLQSSELSQRYAEGAMVIARLCPVDYHRFHFPCDCLPSEAKGVNGPLYSVNPMALKRNIAILSENKRMITQLHTERFGLVLYIEVGATYVGSIHQTYRPHHYQAKGSEKGYFSFGGSCLILLFEPNRIIFDSDLIDVSARKMEMKGLLGQSLGIAKE